MFSFMSFLKNLFTPDSKHKAGRMKSTRRKRYLDKSRERLYISGVMAERKACIKRGWSVEAAKAFYKQGRRRDGKTKPQRSQGAGN